MKNKQTQKEQDLLRNQAQSKVTANHACVGEQPSPRNHLNVNEENKSKDGTCKK